MPPWAGRTSPAGPAPVSDEVCLARCLCPCLPLTQLKLLPHTLGHSPSHPRVRHLRDLYRMFGGKLRPDALLFSLVHSLLYRCIALRLNCHPFLWHIVHQFGLVSGTLCMRLYVSLPIVPCWVNSGLMRRFKTVTVLSRPFQYFIAMGNVIYLKYGGQAFYPFPCPFCY